MKGNWREKTDLGVLNLFKGAFKVRKVQKEIKKLEGTFHGKRLPKIRNFQKENPFLNTTSLVNEGYIEIFSKQTESLLLRNTTNGKVLFF